MRTALRRRVFPPDPESRAEYEAVIKAFPLECWRWLAGREGRELMYGAPRPMSGEATNRFLKELTSNEGLRAALLAAVDQAREEKREQA